MSTELDQSLHVTITNLRASDAYLGKRIAELMDCHSSFTKQLDDLEALIKAQQSERELRNQAIANSMLSVAERA